MRLHNSNPLKTKKKRRRAATLLPPRHPHSWESERLRPPVNLTTDSQWSRVENQCLHALVPASNAATLSWCHKGRKRTKQCSAMMILSLSLPGHLPRTRTIERDLQLLALLPALTFGWRSDRERLSQDLHPSKCSADWTAAPQLLLAHKTRNEWIG